MLVEFSERAVKKVVEKRKGTMNKRLMLMAMIAFFFVSMIWVLRFLRVLSRWWGFLYVGDIGRQNRLACLKADEWQVYNTSARLT